MYIYIDKHTRKNTPNSQVRWMNIDGRNHQVLRHVLMKHVGPDYWELAFNTIITPKQRVKTHLFGDVFLLLGKVPSLPPEYIGMYIYACVNMYTYTCVYIWKLGDVELLSRLSTYLYICMHTYIYICLHTYTHTYMLTYMHKRACVRAHVCT
jgi:hypothetical protein